MLDLMFANSSKVWPLIAQWKSSSYVVWYKAWWDDEAILWQFARFLRLPPVDQSLQASQRSATPICLALARSMCSDLQAADKSFCCQQIVVADRFKQVWTADQGSWPFRQALEGILEPWSPDISRPNFRSFRLGLRTRSWRLISVCFVG